MKLEQSFEGNGEQEPAATEPVAASQVPVVPESQPVQGRSLIASALWDQPKRKRMQVVALVFGFLLALRVFRRKD